MFPRTLLRSSLAGRASVVMSSTSSLWPSGGLLSSPVASSSRLLSTSSVDLASGQGSKEVKVKKKSKGAMKIAAKGGKKANQDEDEDDDDSPGPAKNSRGRGVSEDTFALIDDTAAKAEEKMTKVTTWFTEKYDEVTSRGRGKVNGGELVPPSPPLPDHQQFPLRQRPLSGLVVEE